MGEWKTFISFVSKVLNIFMQSDVEQSRICREEVVKTPHFATA